MFVKVTVFHLFSGFLRSDGTIDNEPSIERLAEIAVAYAKAGQ